MSIEMISHCPACGGEMTVLSQTRQITCTFCGNRYSVDTSEARPALTLVAGPSDDVPAAPSETPLTPRSIPEVPPIAPGANTFDLPAAPYAPAEPPAARSRRPIGMIIAIVIAALLCLIFGCMAAGSLLLNNWSM